MFPHDALRHWPTPPTKVLFQHVDGALSLSRLRDGTPCVQFLRHAVPLRHKNAAQFAGSKRSRTAIVREQIVRLLENPSEPISTRNSNVRLTLVIVVLHKAAKASTAVSISGEWCTSPLSSTTPQCPRRQSAVFKTSSEFVQKETRSAGGAHPEVNAQPSDRHVSCAA